MTLDHGQPLIWKSPSQIIASSAPTATMRSYDGPKIAATLSTTPGTLIMLPSRFVIARNTGALAEAEAEAELLAALDEQAGSPNMATPKVRPPNLRKFLLLIIESCIAIPFTRFSCARSKHFVETEAWRKASVATFLLHIPHSIPVQQPVFHPSRLRGH